MQEPRVYIDITFITNFCMDFIILWATARLIKLEIRYMKLTLAAALGAVYACICLFPHWKIVGSLPVKISVSIILLLIALYPLSYTTFKKALLYFYIISFSAAGAALAAPYLFDSAGHVFRFSYLWLLAAGVFVLTVGIAGEKYLKNHWLPSILQYDVEMRFDDKRCQGRGFLDTGNSLRDPLTNQPVLVAEYELLQEYLPEDFRRAVEESNNEQEVLDAVTLSSWAHRLRLIPFQSIGKKNGVLLGIRADEITLASGRKNISYRNLVIGLYRDKLSRDGSFRLLIPAEVINRIQEG
ncbi:sigma-E processing peptidase SpoIIGA [Syntrophomonas palmitatica]|uniref:sigma-E processing peptidase SpoIIGA n=1 Tax=Syntrophomonas palmitatica TaxID=402877 RepID=UPI0006D23C3B|nr:sigma-E processing peptidase SpoIIGA [Syntrophomonas palmitatica]